MGSDTDDAAAADGSKKKAKTQKGKESLEQLGGSGATPPPNPGPLAPWRLSIAVAVSALLTGSDRWDAAMTGVAVDMALLRSFGVAFMLWIATGFVNRILVQAQRAADAEAAAESRERADEPAPLPYVDERSDAGPNAA
ncbi:MAG: hypothetical protein ACK5CE_19500 [Actinomycetes bacterium]